MSDTMCGNLRQFTDASSSPGEVRPVTEPHRIAALRSALGRQLAAYRKAASYSQHQLAPLIGCARSTIANVEVGRQQVPRAFWQRCDELLGAGDRLTTTYDELQVVVSQQRRTAAELEVHAATATELLIGSSSEGNSNKLNYAVQHPDRTDLVAVAQLREQVRRITAEYDTAPSVTLVAAASRLQNLATGLRERARDLRARRELYIAEAEASTLLGQLLWDASQRHDHATTLAQFDHAIAVAHVVHDQAEEAHAVLRKSYVALYGVHRPQVGLALATQAARLSADVSHTLTGIALLHVAEAHGYLGDRKDCEQALDGARTHFGLRSDLETAAEFYSPAQFGRLAGSCYLSLSLPKKAEHHLATTAKAMQTEQKVSAIVLGNLSLAYMRQGKLEEATEAAHQAIDVVECTRGGGGLNVVFAAGRELRAWRAEAKVQAVHDRLLGLMA
jgi:tetratricopeptide (TPR) repeat protein